MEIKRTLCCVVMVHSLLFAAPGAWAQSALTGTIAATGGVLSGVGVRVASPALIEKVRTAVTDDPGSARCNGTVTIANLFEPTDVELPRHMNAAYLERSIETQVQLRQSSAEKGVTMS
jgi:hypothetical protein